MFSNHLAVILLRRQNRAKETYIPHFGINLISADHLLFQDENQIKIYTGQRYKGVGIDTRQWKRETKIQSRIEIHIECRGKKVILQNCYQCSKERKLEESPRMQKKQMEGKTVIEKKTIDKVNWELLVSMKKNQKSW